MILETTVPPVRPLRPYRIQVSLIGIVVCIVSIIWVLSIERTLYLGYMEADSKTQALYGIQEMDYLYKYLFSLGGFLGLIALFIASRFKNLTRLEWTLLVLSFVTLLFPFFRVWVLFVPDFS